VQAQVAVEPFAMEPRARPAFGWHSILQALVGTRYRRLRQHIADDSQLAGRHRGFGKRKGIGLFRRPEEGADHLFDAEKQGIISPRYRDMRLCPRLLSGFEMQAVTWSGFPEFVDNPFNLTDGTHHPTSLPNSLQSR
jgi:hypothetical protein